MALIQTIATFAGLLLLLGVTLLVTRFLVDAFKKRGVPMWIGAPVVFVLSLLIGIILLGFVGSLF